MFKVTPPPKTKSSDIHQILDFILHKEGDKLNGYFEFAQEIDKKEDYIPFDKFQYYVPKHLNKTVAWQVLKLIRVGKRRTLFKLDKKDKDTLLSYVLTPTMQKAILETERNTTTAELQYKLREIDEDLYIKYLLEDLIKDESISSSQLEGAATTTLDAKRMLRNKNAPRTLDEKMIVGNFQMMSFAWKNRDKPLSIDFIKKLHKVGVANIDDEKYSPGQFREDKDKVVIADYDNNIIHTPPNIAELNQQLTTLIEWANQNHNDINHKNYIHPLIKAMVLHFCIGYEHPFKDGNGRVARALFYWFMFKNQYAAFRYIAISTLLKNSAIKYGKSYVHTEMDDMDLTYFIEYQCKIVIRGIDKFKEIYSKAVIDIQNFNQYIKELGLLEKLSEKQQILFNIAHSKIMTDFTATDVAQRFECSYNTAVKMLNGLVDLNLFRKSKLGRETIYTMKSLKSIQEQYLKK
ncbi:Fic family protein [Orbaceae bacterium ESL0721]|nr:Fic family protein [Orbaceae bacterium ESL0721]